MFIIRLSGRDAERADIHMRLELEREAKDLNVGITDIYKVFKAMRVDEITNGESINW
jgi:hypothetical protein